MIVSQKPQPQAHRRIQGAYGGSAPTNF